MKIRLYYLYYLRLVKLSLKFFFTVFSKVCFYFYLIFSGRAMRKVEELERMLDIAKENFRQLGGELAEDRRKHKQIQESKR